jgi:Mg2+ and Co2+ transporter CorA
MSNEPGSFRRLVRNKRKTLEDPVIKAAKRLRDLLDRKQYIAYKDAGLVVNAYLEIIERYKDYKDKIEQSVKQMIDDGLGRLDNDD